MERTQVDFIGEQEDSEKGDPQWFQVITTKRAYQIMCDSKAEADEWRAAMQAAIDVSRDMIRASFHTHELYVPSSLAQNM